MTKRKKIDEQAPQGLEQAEDRFVASLAYALATIARDIYNRELTAREGKIKNE